MDILRKVEHLAAVARLRGDAAFASDAVMARIGGAPPDVPGEEYPVRFLIDMAAAATAVAAAVAVVAFSAWTDLHNPFLALETLGNVLERL